MLPQFPSARASTQYKERLKRRQKYVKLKAAETMPDQTANIQYVRELECGYDANAVRACQPVGLLAMRVCMNSTAKGVVACFAALMACVMIPLTGHAQAPPPGVFSDIQTVLVPQISPALEPSTTRSRVVSVDTQRITAARQGREVLSLNFFNDAVVQLEIERVRPTRSGYFISSRTEGMEWGEVRLVVNGPVVVGTVVAPEGKFTIRFDGSGRHVIRQIDPSVEPIEHDVEEDLPTAGPLPVVTMGDPPAWIARPQTNAIQDQPTEDGSEVRVLVVYTPAMQAWQGGVAGTQASDRSNDRIRQPRV